MYRRISMFLENSEFRHNGFSFVKAVYIILNDFGSLKTYKILRLEMPPKMASWSQTRVKTMLNNRFKCWFGRKCLRQSETNAKNYPGRCSQQTSDTVFMCHCRTCHSLFTSHLVRKINDLIGAVTNNPFWAVAKCRVSNLHLDTFRLK